MQHIIWAQSMEAIRQMTKKAANTLRFFKYPHVNYEDQTKAQSYKQKHIGMFTHPLLDLLKESS